MKEGWTYKKLGDICEVINGFAFKSEKYVDKGIRVMRITNVQKGTIVDNDPKYYPNEEAPNIRQYLLNENDLLMSLTGNVGRVGLLQKELLPAALNQRVACLRIKSNDVLLKYLFHILDSDLFEKDCIFNSSGIAQKNMSTEWLKKYTIPVPPIGEQERIVAELDLLSGIIEKKKAQLKAYDQLAQSIFYTMFGDPITNEKGWQVIQLGSKCEVSSFKRVLIEDVVDKGIPFIRGTELMSLSKGEKTPFTLFLTPEHYEKVKAISGVPKIGDLLIPSINANGSIWVLNTEEPRYYKDGRVLWVHVDKDTYTSQALKYIMHILITSNYSSVASGATFAELKIFVLRELNTILPPLPLQQEFAEKVEAIEKQKALIQQSIDEVQTLFDSRMDYWFG
jgi:type I restriction enzyme S subunit